MRAATVGREEMNARSRRFSSTHAGRGKVSRRSEISSSGDVAFWVGSTRFGGVDLEDVVFTLAAVLFLDFPAVHLRLLWI